MQFIPYDYEAAYNKSLEEMHEWFIENLFQHIKKVVYALKEITAGDQFEIEIYPQFRSMDEVPPEGRTIKKDNNKAQKNLNDKNARKYGERLINENFSDRDIWMTLTYDDAHLPPDGDVDAAIKNVQKYIRRINYQRKKRGLPNAKYVYVTAYNPDAEIRWHHHIVMDGALDMETVESCWKQSILYDRLHKEMYQFHVLQADETPVMVTKDGRPVNSKSYMWIYRTGKSYADTPIILYEYQRTRKADHPEEFLKDFKGIVVCDGYSAYRKLDRENPDIVFAGCWSHARRRFAEALKALPKAAQKNAKETVAYEAVSRIAAIYHLDNQMEGQPAKVRKMYRQANIRPLVEAFFAWAKEIQIKNQLSRGKTLDGINYCINQEVSLKAFLEDGDIPMDNNATESALRSFCLHKHAWKLIDSLDGANASAIIYSITETAKANDLNPFRYLEHVLTVLKDHQDDREYGFIDDILPWSEKLPAICRSKTKATNI